MPEFCDGYIIWSCQRIEGLRLTSNRPKCQIGSRTIVVPWSEQLGVEASKKHMSVKEASSMDEKEKARLNELIKKKLEMVAKVRDLRAEVGKINIELARAGAEQSIIASW